MTAPRLQDLPPKEIAEKIAKYFRPSEPISQIDALFGRKLNIRQIERALLSPGKHVFVYGDRGVGKTSLARSSVSGFLAKPVDRVPFVSCDTNSDFFSIMSGVFDEAVRIDPNLFKGVEAEFGMNIGMFSAKARKPPSEDGASPNSVNQICDKLRRLKSKIDGPLIVLIDEFDLISSVEDKKLFADLIKQVSDRALDVRFFFTGIAKSLEQLIGGHLSTDRYISSIELSPISHEARWDIIQSAFNAENILIPRDYVIRIGQISDGFPFYVHLMGEKLMYAAHDDPSFEGKITPEIYREAVRQAVDETQNLPRKAYELATKKHRNSASYEHALWAVADGTLLQKQVTDIYERSYIRICDELPINDRLAKRDFYQRLNSLKKASHGSIICANPQGWYSFSENIIRGYVRLRAEQAGVKIGIDSFSGH